MNKLNVVLALAAGLAVGGGNAISWETPAIPQSDWEHDDERLRKAEQKRARKAAKRSAEIGKKESE